MLKTKTQSTLLDSMQLAIDIEENNEIDDFLYCDILEDQIENINNELFNFIDEYEERYHTKIAAIAFVGDRFSLYGSIGGNGTPVGKDSESLRLTDCLNGCDDYKLIISVDNKLMLLKLDNNCSNSLVIKILYVTEF